MKKVFFAVSLLMLVFSVVWAGGKSQQDNSKIELQFMSWEASPLESKSIQEGIDAFIRQNPNVSVKYLVVPWSEHHPKLRTMMASGTAPDVFFLNPDYRKDFATAGLLMDITDTVNQYVDMSDFLPSSVEKCSAVINGKKRVIGLDPCIVGPVFYYNKDLFDAAGVPYPPTKIEDQWTWDQFVEYAKKLTKVSGGRTVQYGTSNFEEEMTLYTTLELIGSNGAKWFTDDFSRAVGIDSPETKEALTKIRDLRLVHKVAPDPTAVGLETQHSPTQMFMTGQVASLFGGSYMLQELAQTNIKLGAGLPPKMKEGIKPIGSAALYSIWSGSKYPAESVKLAVSLASLDSAIPVYRTGLWMPNRKSLYKPENLSKWLNKDVYPEGWENMLFLWEGASLRWFDNLTNADQIYNVTSEELQAFFYMNGNLNEILPRMQRRINELLSK
jgi:multiple sugar transport system substrate-binding protein